MGDLTDFLQERDAAKAAETARKVILAPEPTTTPEEFQLQRATGRSPLAIRANPEDAQREADRLKLEGALAKAPGVAEYVSAARQPLPKDEVGRLAKLETLKDTWLKHDEDLLKTFDDIARDLLVGPLTAEGQRERLRSAWDGLDDVDDTTLDEAIVDFQRTGTFLTTPLVRREIEASAEASELVKGLKTGVTTMKQLGTGLKSLWSSVMMVRGMDQMSWFEQLGLPGSEIDPPRMGAAAQPDMSREQIVEMFDLSPNGIEADQIQHYLRGDDQVKADMIAHAMKSISENQVAMEIYKFAVDSYSAEMQSTRGATPEFTSIRGLQDFADWLAFNTGQAVPLLAAAAVTGAVTGGTGLAVFGLGTGMGDINSALLEEGITDRPELAVRGSIPYAATEFLGPAGRLVRGGGVGRHVRRQLLGRTIGQRARRIAREAAMGGFEEFWNEALQEVIVDEAVAKGTGEPVVWDTQHIAKLFNAGMAGVAGGAPMAGSNAVVGETFSVLDDMALAKQAGRTAARLKEIDTFADESPLLSQSPEQFEKAVEAINAPDIYVPAEDVRTFFQANDMSNADLEQWGIDKETYDAALLSGGDVAIPVAKYATYLNTTAARTFLHDHGSMAETEMSVVEAMRFREESGEIWQKIVEDAKTEEFNAGTLKADERQVFDGIYNQLIGAQVSEREAHYNARIWTAFFRTMGERYGSSATELASRFDVTLRRQVASDTSDTFDRSAMAADLDALRNLDTAVAPEAETLATSDTNATRNAVEPDGEAIVTPVELAEGVAPDALTERQSMLQRIVEDRNLDLSTMNNDEVIAALEAPPPPASSRRIAQPSAQPEFDAPSLPKLIEATELARTAPETTRETAAEIPAVIDDLIEEVRLAPAPVVPANVREEVVIELSAARDKVVQALDPAAAPINTRTDEQVIADTVPPTAPDQTIPDIAAQPPEVAQGALPADVGVTQPGEVDAVSAPASEGRPAIPAAPVAPQGQDQPAMPAEIEGDAPATVTGEAPAPDVAAPAALTEVEGDPLTVALDEVAALAVKVEDLVTPAAIEDPGSTEGGLSAPLLQETTRGNPQTIIDAYNAALADEIDAGRLGAQEYFDPGEFLADEGFGRMEGGDYFGPLIDVGELLAGYSDGANVPLDAITEEVLGDLGIPSPLMPEDFRFSAFEKNDGALELMVDPTSAVDERLKAQEKDSRRAETLDDVLAGGNEQALFAATQAALEQAGVEFTVPKSAGSDYINVYNAEGEAIQIRFSDHARQSGMHPTSDVNVSTTGHANTMAEAFEAIDQHLFGQDSPKSITDPRILYQESNSGGLNDHLMGTSRRRRVTESEVVIPAAEEKAIRKNAKALKIPAEDILEYVKRRRAAHPTSDGWVEWRYNRSTRNDKGKIEHHAVQIPYGFHTDADGKPLRPGTPERAAAATTLARKLADEIRGIYNRANRGDRAAKVILRQAGWYKEMRRRLRREFGGMGDLFADFLGATSPNTPVRDNWTGASEALRLAMRGDFDDLVIQWEEFFANVEAMEADLTAWIDEQKRTTGQSKAAIMRSPEYEARVTSVREARKFPDDLLPLKSNGKKFGFNGKNVARAMTHLWRVVKNADPAVGRGGTKPKALNFSGNLIGFRERATIDVWAARLLQRLSKGNRIPSDAEASVKGDMKEDGSTTGMFGFGQDVFSEAVTMIRKDHPDDALLSTINDDDLQAVAWFLEKELWALADATSVAGEGGSFEFEADLSGHPDQDAITELRRIIDSTKSTPSEKEAAIADLQGFKREFDRYYAGLSIEQSVATQGMDFKPSDGEMVEVSERIRSAIYDGDPTAAVVGAKVMSTEGRYGDPERAFDIEISARTDYDASRLMAEMEQIAAENRQDSYFLSRVVEEGTDIDPLKHRPGLEIYFREGAPIEERQAMLDELAAAGADFYTVVVDARGTPVSRAGGMPNAVGIRIQYVPEFDARYGDVDVAAMSDEDIAAMVSAQRSALSDVAVNAAGVDGVSFSDIMWYETEVRFSHEYGGRDESSRTSSGGNQASGGQPWTGQLVREGLEAAARQAALAENGQQFDTSDRWVEGRGQEGRTLNQGLENDLLALPGESRMVGGETTVLDTPELKITEADMAGPNKGRSFRYVAYEDGQAVGALQFATAGPRTKKAKIQNVYVAKDKRRQKVAASLLRRAQEDFDIKHSNDLTNDGAAFAKADGTFYQGAWHLGQGDTSGPRGQIQFPSGGIDGGRSVITLFTRSSPDSSANLSTFQHESAHLFLEMFAALATDDRAPQEMRDDFAAINKHLGSDDTATFTTEQHEMWARSWESYLMEGKSPSLELSDVFSRMKAWLISVYRNLRALNVKMDDEIRGVMDRMLATDEEIAMARASANMNPLFADEKAAGMTKGDWQTYQRMARRAKEQAEQRLLDRTMKRIRIEREKWFKDERATVRSEIEDEVNARPVYRAIEVMANKTWLKDPAREVPDVRIDKAMLVEQFGSKILKDLAHTRGGRAIWAADGMSPAEVAELFGFASAGDMIKQMRDAPRRKDVIEGETDARMTETHGDPLHDGSIEDDALTAIHSDQQSKTVAVEVRTLAKRLGKPVRNITSKVFRQRARLLLGAMPVADATKSSRFLQAERRAARSAEKAFAQVARQSPKADEALASALRFKEQQLLNQMLFDEARILEAEVEKGRRRMQDYRKSSIRKKLEGGYIEQIDALLERFDFRRRTKKQITRAESLNDFVTRMEEAGRGSELSIDSRLLDEANRKHYSRMTVDEIRGLFDTIKNLDHIGRFKQKLRDAQGARELTEVIKGIRASFRDHVKLRPPNRTKTKSESRKHILRDFMNLTLNADSVLREIDGWNDLGPAWNAIKKKVDEGQHRLIKRRVEMAKAFDKIYDVYTFAEKSRMGKKRQYDELGGLFSKWDIIAIALNTGNEGNFQRLTNDAGFTKAQVESALNMLDERDWRTVQNIWDYTNSFWGEIAAKQKRSSGVAPEKVDAKLMVDAPAFVTGGYYPIAYDRRLADRVRDMQEADLAQELIGGRPGKAQTKDGHNEARVTKTNLPLKIDLSVVHEHVANVLQDLELGEAVANSWRILHDRRVANLFRNAGKASDFESLEIWLKDVAAGEKVAVQGAEAYIRWARTGFVLSKLALNLSTAAIQFTGITQTAVLIGKGATAKGTLSYLSRPVQWRNEVLEVSPMMQDRQKTFERDMFNILGEMDAGPSSRFKKFSRDWMLPFFFLFMQKTQFYTVDMPTWVAAYNKHIAETNNEADARTYADTMVKRAQGSGLMSDRGMLERGTISMNSRQREIYKIFTALGAYMFSKYNIAYEATKNTNPRNPLEVMNWVVNMGLLFTLEAVAYNAIKGYLPGEDEDDPEEIALWLATETGMSALSTVPFVRDVAGAIGGFGAGGVWGSMGETVARPIAQASQMEWDRALVTSMTNLGGMMLHLPSSQTNAALNAIYDEEMRVKRNISLLELSGLGGGRGRSIFDLLMDD